MRATKRSLGASSLSATLVLGAATAVLAAAALSLVHPWGNLRSGSATSAAILAGANAPEEIRRVLAQKCDDCHSNNTRWPLYSKIAPASWLVEHDVHHGREHMNLSLWEQYSIDSRVDLLSKIGTEIRQAKMPLRQYLLLHPEARLSDSERKLIQDWAKGERKRLMAEEMK
jgi:cytochrome c